MLISGPDEALCLAYANTRFWRGRERPFETLADLPGLLSWLEKSAGVSHGATQEVAGWSGQYPEKAARMFADAMALREALYAIFSSVTGGQPPGHLELASLQHALVEAPARDHLVSTATGYAWQVDSLPRSAPGLIAPVLWSAGDLMTNGLLANVRRCANDECLWLFLDTSKAGTRRWCAMASCGNRDKARRHYLRAKAEAERA